MPKRKSSERESAAIAALNATGNVPNPDMELDEGRVVMGTRSSNPPSPAADTGGTSGNPKAGDARSNLDGPGPQVMAADTLEGDDVVNSRGEDLGEIKDIMLDVQSGRIAYAVLSCGGFLGMGKKLFAIPWEALTLDADSRRFVLDVDQETLKGAPGFDKDHWPSMADRRWAMEVHSYFGTRPYWEHY